ncbi:hypothetical protein [Massilia timonae]|uniref:hypothetical protein n=1 Tax=Massilia timonae TaxID=47229 RepID=UPI002353D033|nr:hypothetical protein [Massilia timonae]
MVVSFPLLASKISALFSPLGKIRYCPCSSYLWRSLRIAGAWRRASLADMRAVTPALLRTTVLASARTITPFSTMKLTCG